MKSHIKDYLNLSLFTAICAIIGIVESIFPIVPSIPGGKIGFANIFIVTVLYLYGVRSAFFVDVFRTIITALLYSGVNALIYSLSGAILSITAMSIIYILFKNKVSPIGICVIGALFSNIAQILVASLMLSDLKIFSYYYILAPISIISGIITGIGVNFILKYKNTILGAQK